MRIKDTYLPYIRAKAEAREEGRVEGIEEGKVLGLEEGKVKNLTQILKTLISKNYTFDESCDLLDIDEETKEKLLNTGEFWTSK